ncbi:MAG: tRNA (adenosine(37)-N6)-threonylcarbamoyltransferase complex dimerization subunit type 1 TsaB [Dyadobacter sp.]|uniref:tRNA (adenosine(37)-N6)-threonylcarbamoyltransferase complex dimerization subunit type 1 TsaB n=1 Tax=Dyadobacter sp. TaxID=1914288 RepID=UPI001B1D698A|nr:tRNA (adenosine(37)-N6)-threonylcarbamoyltransferase complex dimerization subunit type 1 TsaB [Dyadobacter sp.]MBO9615671.1 tRNA (adenosine(37)-N6)-threonylcarbamoyltransferase complex dimerization subunit type 1 TsaB [Dyadobacter sp.]
MLLLSIDTSIRGCSVAVHNETGLLAAYDLFTDKSSSAMLTSLMRDSVTHAGFELSDIDAIVVAKGPGSYTGLRVGVSTAKGLCYALDKPLIAINTLQAMAMQLAAFFPGHLFCPMIDARRMEVYAAVLDDTNAFVQETQAVIMNETSFQDLLTERRVVFFGDGAAKCKPLLEKHPNAVFPAEDIKPSARTVGQLGTIAFQNSQFENVASFEPYYLKDFMSPAPRKASTLVQ